MAKRELKISDLSVERDGQTILTDVSLSVSAGQLVALVGPNGSGKSSLANAVMGHPKYRVTAGSVKLDGREMIGLGADQRARSGLFLSMQAVPEVPGVSVSSFLRAALGAQRGTPVLPLDFLREFKELLNSMGLPESFAGRGLNEGFSGGERKRLEILQLLLMRPKYALLDEIDAGLDADAAKLLNDALRELLAAGTGILLVTHGPRILDNVTPNAVVLMTGGRVARRGGPELARQVAESGYGSLGGSSL